MFAEFAFVVTLAAPVFDANHQARWTVNAPTAEVASEACDKMRRAISAATREMTMRVHISECRNVTPAPAPLDDELEK